MIRLPVSGRALSNSFASLLLALLALAALGNAHAQDERRGFLFEIRKGTQVSLLFGTIHVGRPEFYPLPASRLSRLSGFDALVLEADVTDTTRAIDATQKFAMYAAGEDGLDKRLSPDLLKRVEAVLARNQLARVIRTGRPAERSPSVRGSSGDEEAFINAMGNLASPVADQIIRAIQPLEFRHVLDIGGASGTWTIAFLRACANASATLFDLPPLIPMATPASRGGGTDAAGLPGCRRFHG